MGKRKAAYHQYPSHTRKRSSKSRAARLRVKTENERNQTQWSKQQENALKNDVKTEFQPTEDLSTNEVQDPLALKTLVTEIKYEEDSDIDIKDHTIESFNSFETDSISHDITSTDQSQFEIDAQETAVVGLCGNIENCEPSTSTSGSKWASNITTPSAEAKQSIQNRWKNIAEKISEPIIKEAPRTYQKKRTTVKGVELCVLCAKDIAKIPVKKPVTQFSKIILALTNVDVMQYPIFPNCCGVCYATLIAIKKFQEEVLAASVLIREKLFNLPGSIAEENFAFATSITHNDVKIESDFSKKMDVGEIESEDSSAITHPILKTYSKTASALNTLTSQVAEPNQLNAKDKNGADTSENKNESVICKMACPVCEKLCDDLTNYDKHMQTHKGIIIACKICTKQLPADSMRNHVQRHKNKKGKDNLVCAQCGKMYPNSHKLKLHEVIHGEKTYACAICGVSFHYDYYLARHMRSHSGEKPHACSECDKTFGTLWNLHQHQRLHTDSRPYKCKICSAAFRHNVTLKGHLTTSHTANEIAASISKDSADDLETAPSKAVQDDVGDSGSSSSAVDKLCDNEKSATNS